MKGLTVSDIHLDRRAVLAGTMAAGASAALSHPAFGAAQTLPPFPKDFLWGVATAGHQIEGNNVNSDVWALEHLTPTTYAEPSGDAANSFELWESDLDLVRNLGLGTYRFSLEWARIEPTPGSFSIAMLDHYKAIMEGCHRRGITPFVTFNHYTTPRWFAERGGWTNRDAPELFARFCERAARHLADGMGHATTLNEPNLTGQLAVILPAATAATMMAADRAMTAAAARAYGAQVFSPGNAVWVADPAATQANMIAAHRAGRQAIKAVRADLPVGVSLAIIDDQAAGAHSMRDSVRAKFYEPWLEAAREDDFIGVQNYGRTVWSDTGPLPTPAGVETNGAGGEIYPASLADAVRYAHSVARVPVIVTEHGLHTSDDTQRARFIPASLKELRRTMSAGVPVLGYIHWSLIDNFEWISGYGPKFGLHSLDRSTFARTPKPSAAVLAAIVRANRV
ncbi:family 1 glycosylhydrolase [Novosphingobium sp. 9]|uniref:family 1 glycosylhydrolase n=1 Tax=Novosphingobium sp. 9 TaxID=2025349 RepID=UPI0021B4E162|nr:family 1 glycosylhydrolase [Novosphingobium sp. 9]